MNAPVRSTPRRRRRPRAAALLAGAWLAGAGAEGLAMNGEVSIGWRGVSVDGDRAKYRQQINLDDGPRLFDLRVDWREPGGAAASGLAPDRLTVDVDNLGGDPFETLRIETGRTGRYSASYRRHESEYFYDDLLVRPEAADVESSTGGDFRRFDFERVQERAELRVHLNPRATIELDLDRYERRGDGELPVDVSREEFEFEAPVDERQETLAGSFGYRWDQASLTLTERYRRLDVDNAWVLPGLSEGSEPDSPTRLELFFLDQPWQLRSLEHQLDLELKATQALRLGVTALAGDADVDVDVSENSQGTDFLGQPFTRDQTGSGSLDQDRRHLDLRADYRLAPRLSLFGAFELSEFEQRGAVSFDSDALSDWCIDSERAELGVAWSGPAGLSLSGSLHAARRQVDERLVDDATPSSDAVNTDADGYAVQLAYRPDGHLSAQLSLSRDRLDDPYALAAASDRKRLRLKARYRLDNGLSLLGAIQRSERDNDSSGWASDADQADLRVAFARSRLSLSAGVSRVEVDREIDALVQGGSQARLLLVDYVADTTLLDATLLWRFGDGLSGGAEARRYDNDGSFAVDRDDLRLFLAGTLSQGLSWRLEYRGVDFEEGGIEQFDADIVELALGVTW